MGFYEYVGAVPFQSFPCYGVDCIDLTTLPGIFERLEFTENARSATVVHCARSPEVFEYL